MFEETLYSLLLPGKPKIFAFCQYPLASEPYNNYRLYLYSSLLVIFCALQINLVFLYREEALFFWEKEEIWKSAKSTAPQELTGRRMRSSEVAKYGNSKVSYVPDCTKSAKNEVRNRNLICFLNPFTMLYYFHYCFQNCFLPIQSYFSPVFRFDGFSQ